MESPPALRMQHRLRHAMEPIGSVGLFPGPFGYQESQAKKFLEAHTGAFQILRLGETELCMVSLSSSQAHQSVSSVESAPSSPAPISQCSLRSSDISHCSTAFQEKTLEHCWEETRWVGPHWGMVCYSGQSWACRSLQCLRICTVALFKIEPC